MGPAPEERTGSLYPLPRASSPAVAPALAPALALCAAAHRTSPPALAPGAGPRRSPPHWPPALAPSKQELRRRQSPADQISLALHLPTSGSPTTTSSSSSPAMDGDGFDDWGSQTSANGPARAPAAGAPAAGFDLNSEAPAGEGFPGLGLYGSILQGDDDEILLGRDRGSGLPPYRPPRAGAGAGDGRATSAQPFARQLNFGGSSSAATGRRRGNGGVFPGGSSSGAGGSVRQRANSAATAPIRRNQRTSTALHGSGGQRVPRSRPPRAPRSTVRGQPSGSDAPFDNADEEMEDDAEELASSGGLSVSQTNRAQWNDVNSACLLELCLEQRAAGTYNGSQMSGEGYEAVIDGLLARRRLLYNRLQVKNQILILKSTYSFWRYMQTHTGLGRKPDGSIDADSDFWITNTEVLALNLFCNMSAILAFVLQLINFICHCRRNHT